MSKPFKGTYVRTYEQVSAGGIVFRQSDSGTEIVIVKIVPEMRWQLPKGIIDDGETPQIAALREVREEAGVEAVILEPIDMIEYWFTAERNGEQRRYHKFVHFFLMKYETGDVSDHDDEVAEARWVAIDEAMEMLAFKSEREIVGKAAMLIENIRV